MSVRRMSKRVKSELVRSLSTMSPRRRNHEDYEEEEYEGRNRNDMDERRKGAFNFKIFMKKKEEPKLLHILITGGSGHIAAHLVDAFAQQVREEVRREAMSKIESDIPKFRQSHRKESVANVRKSWVSSRLEAEVTKLMHSRLQITLVDIIEPDYGLIRPYTSHVKASFTDEYIMKSVLKHVDTVIHLAAVGMTGHYAHDRKACMDINATGTMNLLSWAKSSGVKRFIYTSSIGVIFNGKPLKNVNEIVTYPESFYNFYCESKAQAEQIVVKASTCDLRTVVLRFNGIYGPGEKRVTERVVDFMISGWWIGMCKPNGKEAQTQLSSVANCVQGILKAEKAMRGLDSLHGQIYNIMDKEPAGTFTFWQPLNDGLGFARKMINIPVWVIRPMAWLSQWIANTLKVDPIVSLLEVDLLLNDTTFDLKKSRNDRYVSRNSCRTSCREEENLGV
uniref:3Beta_HSD domain-containing protein n=2 Tax=Caenorhabditis japonica TaxID=281687 RepID=A0A8R1I4Z6_CAEJA